jgi:hypothetical protein
MDAALKAEVGFGVEVFDLGGERYAKVGAAIDVGEDLFAAAEEDSLEGRLGFAERDQKSAAIGDVGQWGEGGSRRRCAG